MTVEEELQDGDASARNCSMTCRICWMRRGAFRKCLRKEIIPILLEAALHGLRIENIRVGVTLDSSAVATQNLLKDCVTRGSMTPLGVATLSPMEEL